jgi:iron complex transport system substrate-binding protein
MLFACGEERGAGALPGELRVGETEEVAARIVSLNPSITNILVALGAGDTLVGVDDWSARVQPAVESLPKVGGLFNPSLEAILALEPDLVALVPSAQQRDLRDRLVTLGMDVLVLENLTLAQVLHSIQTLGARVDRASAANERIEAILAAWRATSERTAELPRMRTVLVLQRDPLYIVGRGSFLDEMLVAAGAENLGAVFDEEYPRAGSEWLIGAAPELVLDAAGDAASARAHWSQWPSLPAVAADQIVSIPAEDLTMPGPDLDQSLARLADWVDGARAAAP